MHFDPIPLDRSGDREVGFNFAGSLYVVTKHPRELGSTYRSTKTQTFLHDFDLKHSDDAYWASVKKFLLWLSAAFPLGRDRHYFATVGYKALRRLHHEAQRKTWDQVLPKEIADWAHDELQRE